jgi:glucuronoxylan 4-O-methyltransferase
MDVLKTMIQVAMARFSVSVCAVLPYRLLLWPMRYLNHIQLSARDLERISAAVRSRRACRLLVFGLGHDSRYWTAINNHGRTVFLEDDVGWRRTMSDGHIGLNVLQVQYTTRRAEWRALLDQPDRLRPEWSGGAPDGDYDVILVDGPAGWHDGTPGRMQSIVAAIGLAADGSDLFIHDCDREVEREYCDRFLPATWLEAEIDLLRHYRKPAR